ncbi:MAG: 1-deoxy-D-xylulose-5-phosphate reductoisomerase [Deltaproteobacteria bacterium]|nr:1-deoxy-D-xylulose-5-phosphate reductoisomerase [Deltaproteobacteria bacterium]
MKKIGILGSTGSIGVSSLDVIARFPALYDVVALAAGRNIERLSQQILRFRPQLASIANPEDLPRLRELLEASGGATVELVAGPEGAEAIAGHTEADLVITAMVGAAGLKPTLTAIRRGVQVAIANKEPLVMAGELCTREAMRWGAELLPVDSEHSAIFQCLKGRTPEHVRRLVLTCSGGPFRQRTDLSSVTRAEALKHPTWSMGEKITVDSATLMNKGLEVIEARWLFSIPAQSINVVIHPQSVVHSFVELQDGSVLAQLGTPDMRGPIAYALAHPERLPLDLPRLDVVSMGRLDFEAPDRQRFPALDLAYEALRVGGTAPAILNAANEEAVAAFLADRLPFVRIVEVVREVLERVESESAQTLDALLEADRLARIAAKGMIS